MLFSVIVPMYNVQQYADTCINSILNQSYEDFELIIVNDGSKDNTPEIIDYYACSDSRIRVVNKENGGITSARKAGIACATGEYIVTVDGDDWIELNALEAIAKVIEETQADIAFFGHYSVDAELKKSEHVVVKQQMCLDRSRIYQELIPCFFGGKGAYRYVPNLWNKVFRREIYEKYCSMLDNRIVMGEDGAIAYPCIFEAREICLMPEMLYNYRLSPDSLTRSKKKYLKWETAELRVKHYTDVFASAPEMKKHIARFASHSYFNVALSQLKHDPYNKVKKELLGRLSSGELRNLLKYRLTNATAKQRLARLALYYKLVWLIKVYAMVA